MLPRGLVDDDRRLGGGDGHSQVCGPETRIATTDINIRFLAPARSEVKVRAQLIKAGRTLVPVAANLWDSTGELVAVAQVNYIRLECETIYASARI